MKETSFTFARQRGVVWVCDIEKSSRYLNDTESVQAIEEYLPRLHWLAKVAVSAADGHFVKWTGDGFLAWFPIELHRKLGSQAARVLKVIWQLTVINNVTCLGIKGGIRFRLKHGLTVEHDALMTTVSEKNGEYFDLIGRSVVLAFRFAGMKVSFPGIVTQREVVEATRKENISLIKFEKLSLSADERLRYFKGDRWGTTNLFASAERKPRARTKPSLLRKVSKTIAEAEKPSTIQGETNSTIRKFTEDLQSGPLWTQEVLRDYLNFLREDVLGTLKKVARELDSSLQKPAQ